MFALRNEARSIAPGSGLHPTLRYSAETTLMPTLAATPPPAPALRPTLAGGVRLLAQAFRKEPLGVRLHVVGRFLTCPFLRLLPYLPEGARLLDLGAGHGAFAHLAAAYRNASSVALEPDPRKVLPAPRQAAIRRVVGYAGAVRGGFDAVSILDVLYRVPFSGWDEILGSAFASLRPGGLLLLKEIDPENRLKGAWNRTQEKGADLLGLTLGEAHSYEPRTALLARLARLGFVEAEAIPLGAFYPHAHLLYRAMRPSER